MPAAGRRANDVPPKAPTPLAPLVGNMWMPAWAVRPGSYTALRGVALAMPLWLLLHSRNQDFFKPCYASREDLGITLGIGMAKVSRQLGQLRKVGLLFEVERGVEPKTKRHRPPARWALDPFTDQLWREKMEAAIVRVAEEDGHDGRWLCRAVTAFEAFARQSRFLIVAIRDDMPFPPRKPRRRRKKKRISAPNRSRATVQHEPRGDVFTRGGGRRRSERNKVYQGQVKRTNNGGTVPDGTTLE